jgi:Protein of unknown function (DUF2946)
MDDIVKRAMAKWPNVPDCFNWLGLDRRGNWCLRDDATQALGPFPMSRGDVLEHTGLIDFIGRNYGKDDSGRWFFQNGPQRVFIELECTPFIWRVQVEEGKNLSVHSHTQLTAQVLNTYLDESGLVYLETDLGFGLVHSMDMWGVGEVIDQGIWSPIGLIAKEMPERFGFIQSPASNSQEKTT